MLTLKSDTQSQKEKEQDEKALYNAVVNRNKDEVGRLIAKGVSSTAYKDPYVSKILTLYSYYLKFSFIFQF